METITLTFGTTGHVNFSVSSVQNNYEKKNFLPIVIEEDGPSSYMVNIFGADNLDSVFPVFTTTETSFFKFEHGGKFSPCIQVKSGKQISSFLTRSNSNSTVYGLEILTDRKQTLFEKCGGHTQKNLNVWFGIDEGEDDCGIFFRSRTETDGISTELGKGATLPQRGKGTPHPKGWVATLPQRGKGAPIVLNNSSQERYKQAYFEEPKTMNERTFHFCFRNEKMMGNIYL
jgi:hypothetical protein